MIELTNRYERATTGPNNVIKSVYVSVTGKDSDTGAYITIGEDIQLPDPPPDKFIDFKNITKDDLDVWLAVNEDYLSLVEKVKNGISSQNQTDVKALPWEVSNDPPPNPTVPVPDSLSPRQLRLILNAYGLLESVEAFVAQQDKPIQLAWQFATTFLRDDQLLNTMAQYMGITQDQIDQMFIQGAEL